MKCKLYDDIDLAILRSSERIELLTDYSLFCKKILPLINKDDTFEMVFLNLFERNICNYLIQRKEGLNTNEYSLSVLAYRELFTNDGLNEETEKIIEEHIRFIIDELKWYDELEFETPPKELEIYYFHMISALNSFIRTYGIKEVKNYEKVSAYFKDISGNELSGEAESICSFFKALHEKTLTYPDDLFFLQILYKSIRECGVEYQPLKLEYENMMDCYANMFEYQMFNSDEEDENIAGDDDDFDEEENTVDNFENLLNEARLLRRNNNVDAALNILNMLLDNENNYFHYSIIYYEISLCYQAKKDYITALIKIEKALELAPNSPIYHWMKGIYSSSNRNLLEYFVEGFKALELSNVKKDKDFFSMDMIKAAESIFNYFSVYNVKDYEFSKYIGIFQNLSELEVAPQNIREKYKNYKQECLSRLKQKINEDSFGSEDDIYEKKMNLCKQFLSLNNINNREKISVIKQYANNKSIVRFYYGYRLNDDLSKIDIACCTGDILLENGIIVTADKISEIDLTIGVVLKVDDKILLIDSYEYEYSDSAENAVEINGWHLASSEELKLILKHKEKINYSLERITGAKIFKGHYKDKSNNKILFSQIDSNNWIAQKGKTRFVKEIDLLSLGHEKTGEIL